MKRKSSHEGHPISRFTALRRAATAAITVLAGAFMTAAACDVDGDVVSDPFGRMGSAVSSKGVRVRTAVSETPSNSVGALSTPLDGSGPASVESGVACDSDDEKKVLFIGNSYTYYHHMPKMVADMASSAGCRVQVSWATNGGYRLALHAKDPATLEAIRSEEWDLVVLQNQSQRPGFRLEDVAADSLPVVEYLTSVIRGHHPSTDILYYVTWGRRGGDRLNCDYYDQVCSFDGHTEALRDGYSLYASLTGGSLADVGRAFELVVKDDFSPLHPHELYDADGTHPSKLGSYLAASVFFYEIFGLSPEGLAFPTVLTAENAAYLQQVAATAVEGRELGVPGASVVSEERVVATCRTEECGPTEALQGKPTTMVMFAGTCSDWYLRTEVEPVARVSTAMSCNSQACTTGSINTWTRDSGDAIPEGTYSVFVNVDVDESSSSSAGDFQACENSAVTVGSGERVRITRFDPFETFS